MLKDRLYGKKIIVFHVSSVGQVQFIAPIYDELKRRNIKASYYLASDYPVNNVKELNLPVSKRMSGRLVKNLFLVDIFLQTEIYGRGPKSAKRVFIGHGQPNKITNWSDDNLRSFEHYFLYGELERDMFEEIMKDKPESTKHIYLFNVGYPKLDSQMRGDYDHQKVLKNLDLNPENKTVIYAPAWDPGGALRTYGIKVIDKLLEIENINVLVKLHPVSMEAENSPYFKSYTGGVNWQEELNVFNGNPNFRFINESIINPFLTASDVMVTDFSGVALEFMTMDRPVIYIDCPEFYEKTLMEWGSDPVISKHDDRFNAGRNAGTVVFNLDELSNAVQNALTNPDELSGKRKKLVDRFLYNPGKGSQVTSDLIIKLLFK